MANEFRHGSVGTELTQAEWEAVGTHVLNSQATGDIVYAASSSQLSRLGRGADNTVLHLASGIPAWSATLAGLTLTTPTISSTGFANANHAHAASNSGGTISAGALSGSTLASGVTASSLTSVGTIATGVWQGTDVGVAYGGTGVSTLLTNAVLTGNGASAIQAETTLLFSSNKLIPTASAHDAAGTVLSMSAGATTAGTTNNIAGGALTLQGGQGKGSGAGGDIIFQTANAGGSGSSLNALATALTLSDDLSATFAGDVDLNSSGDLLNVAASGNDWDSTSLRSGLIEATVTGGTTQIGVKLKNLQTKVNGVGPMMAMYGHTTGQTMAYVYSVWAEESAAADTTTLNFATRNTAGSTDARMTIHGNGDIDLISNDLLNIGASGNDWTTNAINLNSARAGGSNQILIYNTDTTAYSSAILRLETNPTNNAGVDPYIDFHINGVVGWQLGVDNSESDRFALSTTGFASNDAFRVSLATPPVMTYNTSHPTGTFDYVCESCGQHQAELFSCCGSVDWHDDVLDFRAMALRDPDALDYMERVGVIEQGFNTDGDPEIFTVLGRDFEFSMSAAFQNRQRMDAQNEAMDARLKRIEQALGV
jgi:hypothetical protein